MRTLLITTAATALLGLAACGGDDRLSADEYASRATDICTRADKEVDRISDEIQGGGGSDVEQFDKVIERTKPVFEGVRDDLDELQPPEEHQAGADALKADIQEAIDKGPQISQALKDGDEEKARQLVEDFGSYSDETKRFAADVGIEKCVEGD